MDDGDHAATGMQTEYRIGGPAATLVVRAWLEPGADGTLALRGTVAVLGGRMLGAFVSPERLSTLVAQHLAEASGPAAAAPRDR